MLERRLEKIKIFLEKGYTADIESGLVFGNSKHCSSKTNIRGSVCKSTGYIVLTTYHNGKSIVLQAHQFIYYLATGKVVEEIDHKNRIKIDNRIKNLRELPKFENILNRSFKGYSFRKDSGKWRVRITINNKNIQVGDFNTEEEAIQARIEALEKYHIIGNREKSLENSNLIIKKSPKYYAWDKLSNKWQARMKVNGKNIHLGYFHKESEAQKAVAEAKLKYNKS